MENDGRFSEKNLYEVLGVGAAATQQEIRKAYHKLALRFHPDKNKDDEEANEKFQQLQKVISIFGDEEKRAIYDQTGSVDDDDLSGYVVDNLRGFFTARRRKLTVEDIEELEANYRGSDSEKKDLIELYTKFKGKMRRLFDSMICSRPKLDSHRFKDIINEAIAAGEVKSTKAYKKWAKKISEIKPPTCPLKMRPRKAKKSAETDLYALISQRREERNNTMFSRYGGNAESVPTEEEFEAAKRRIAASKRKAESQRSSSSSKKKSDRFRQVYVRKKWKGNKKKDEAQSTVSVD